MSALIVSVVLLGSLFAVTYLTKRRFGQLGFGLAAGSLLSSSWTASLTPVIAEQGIVLASPPLHAVVASVLIVAPALVLLFTGPTYDKTPLRVAGSVAFAVLAFTLLSKPLATGLEFDSTSLQLFEFVTRHFNLIVGAGMVLALADALLPSHPRKAAKSDKH